MRVNLTITQRRICMGAAAVIGLLLWMQAQRVGIEDTPWLIGVLLIAALLAVAFAPSQSGNKSASTSVARKGIVPAKAMRAAYDVFEAEFMPMADSARIVLANELVQSFEDHVRLQAVKLAWMTTATVLMKEYPGFRKGQQFDGFTLMGGAEARKYLRSIPGIEGEQAQKKSLEAAAKEIGACVVGLDRSCARLVMGQKHPMNPAYEVVEHQLSFAKATHPKITNPSEQLDAAYGPVFRRAVAAARNPS